MNAMDDGEDDLGLSVAALAGVGGSQIPGQALRLDDAENMLKSSFRTMALFEFFADVKRPASIGEIADNLNMLFPSPSAKKVE